MGESLVLCLFCSQILSVFVVVCSPGDPSYRPVGFLMSVLLMYSHSLSLSLSLSLRHTLLGSSVVTSQPVTRQAPIRASLKVQSFTDDQAVTVLEQEDEVCGVWKVTA